MIINLIQLFLDKDNNFWKSVVRNRVETGSNDVKKFISQSSRISSVRQNKNSCKEDLREMLNKKYKKSTSLFTSRKRS
jgi:hypothetical protein